MPNQYLDPQISVPFKAYTADALTIADIDAHVDSARIWATVLEIRKQYDIDLQNEIDNSLRESPEETNIDRSKIDDVEKSFNKLAKSFTLKDFEAFRLKLEDLLHEAKQ